MPSPNKRARGNAQPPRQNTKEVQQALRILSREQLLAELDFLCNNENGVEEVLAGRLLVRGKDVSRYHADTDSEENENEESEEDEDEDEDDEEDDESDIRDHKKRRYIRARDEEVVPRIAKCLNCREEFDVTENEERECRWHTGNKELDWEGDFWADHDDRCHGDPYSFVDDPDYAGGFQWSCCEAEGDDEGCRATRHKADVNQMVSAPPTKIDFIMNATDISPRKRPREVIELLNSSPEPAEKKRKAAREPKRKVRIMDL